MTTIGPPPFLVARHGRVGQVFSGAAQAIAMTVLIIVGLLSGLATPTETAVAASVYAFLVGVFIYRELPLQKVPKIVIDSAISSAAILVLIGTANVFGWILVSERIPQTIAAWVLSFTDNRIIVILLINLTVLMLVSYIPAISTWLLNLIAK